jgi:hypothetical protein
MNREIAHPIGDRLIVYTNGTFWTRMLRDPVKVRIAANLFTMILTLCFVMPWLNDLKQMNRANTLAWIHYYSPTMLGAMHKTLRTLFSPKELNAMAGLSFPMRILWTTTQANRASFSNGLVRYSDFTRSFMNVLMLLLMFTMTIKGAAMCLPAKNNSSHFESLMRFYSQPVNRRQGVFGLIESVKALTGQPTAANRYVDAFRGTTQDLLSFCGYVWTYAGVRVVYDGYTLLSSPNNNRQRRQIGASEKGRQALRITNHVPINGKQKLAT